MWKYLNRGISTPLAITIILILVIALGAFSWWQYEEIKKENSTLNDKDLVEKEEKEDIAKCSNFKFEEYSVKEIYEGEISELKFETVPDYYDFDSDIKSKAQEGPNFAGKYTIITWSCGDSCQRNIIIDSQTGEFLDDFFSSWGSEYKIDSSLLISELGVNKGEEIKYYNFENERLKIVCEIDEEEEKENPDKWKVYKNQEHGFEFRYPGDFIVEEEENSEIKFSLPGEESELFLFVEKEPKTLLFRDSFEGISRELALNSMISVDISKNILINSINWKKEIWFLQSDLKVISYYAEYEDDYYTFAIGFNDPSYEEKEAQMEQILSTFSFVK
jgi:hypothetical protein